MVPVAERELRMPEEKPDRYIKLTDGQLTRRWHDLYRHTMRHLDDLRRLEETVARTEQCVLDAETEMKRRGMQIPFNTGLTEKKVS